MPLPRSFKTDESFLEKIAIGATGTRRVFDDVKSQGHQPIELERGSMLILKLLFKHFGLKKGELSKSVLRMFKYFCEN